MSYYSKYMANARHRIIQEHIRGGGVLQTMWSDWVAVSSLKPDRKIDRDDPHYNPRQRTQIKEGDYENKSTTIDRIQLKKQMKHDLVDFTQTC